MKILNLIRRDFWLIGLVLISFGVSGLWFYDGLAKSTGESGLLFVTLERQLGFTLHTWLDTTIGDTSFSFNGASVLYALLYLLSKFLKPGYVEGLFFAASMIVGSLGIGFLTKELVKNIGQPFLFFIGLAYLFNPYSIMFVWNRFLYNGTLAYGLLPLLIFLWVRYLKKPRLKYLAVFFFVSFLGSFAFTGIAYILVFFMAVGLWTILLLPSFKGSKKKYVLLLLLLSFTFFLSQSFWLLPFISGNRFVISQSKSFFSTSANLLTTKNLSDYYGGVFNKLTMYRADMDNLALQKIPLAQWYIGYLPTLVSWIPLIMIFLSSIALAISKLRAKVAILLCSGILLLAVNGTKAPLGDFYLMIYKIHPILQALRNPYEKLGELFYINFFILWGIGLWLTWSKFSKLLGGILLSLSFVWLIISAWPVVNGVVFTYKYKVDNDPKIGFRVKVPEYYSQAGNVLEKPKYAFRGIALPMSGEGITHKWEYGYDGVESYNGLFNFPFISLDTTIFHLPEIAATIKSASTPGLLRLAPRINADYVVNREDIYVPASSRDPKEIKQDLSKYLSSQEIGKLDIFDIPENFRAPRIFLSDQLVFSNKSSFGNILDLGENTKSVLVDASNDFKSLESQDRLVVPDFLIDDLDLVPPTHPDNAIKTLPYSNYPPNHPLYFLIKLKEKISQVFNLLDSEALSITLAGKRLKEIVLIADSSDRRLLSKAIESYFQYLEPVVSAAGSEIQSNKLLGPGDVKWWEIFWYHTTTFDKLLASSQPENRDLILQAKEKLNNLLTFNGINPIYESRLKQFSSNYLIKRALIDIPTDGKYEFRMKIGVKGMKPLGTIQVDNNLVRMDFSYDDRDEVFKAKLDIKKGRHELRIPTPFQKIGAQKEELAFDTDRSLSNSLSVKDWNLSIPYGSGEADFVFEYRIIQGTGPKTVLENKENPDNSLISERQEFPNSYYFDWATSLSAVKFNRNIRNLSAEVSVLPYNICDRATLKNSGCRIEESRKRFDRRSRFLARNVSLIIIPTIKIALKSESQNINTAYSDTSFPQTSWEKINPSLYRVKIANNSAKNMLVFSDQYHSGWKLFPVKSTSWGGEILKKWDSFNVEQLSTHKNFLNSLVLTLSTLGTKPLDENNHVLVNAFANGWKVPQGDSNWILLFTPERELYIGWGITILAFVAFTLFGLRELFSNKRKKG